MHSSRPPSKMKAILLCAGQTNFLEQLGYKGSTNAAAQEGSMLHDIVEYIIHDCLHVRHLKEEGFSPEQIGLVGQAMDNYGSLMLKALDAKPGEPVISNTEVVRHLPPFPTVFGTIDVEALIGRTLYIKDWKFGSWPVEIGTIEDPNAQLATYACMSYLYWIDQGYEIDFINISLCQPKNDHEPELTFTEQELFVWFEKVLLPGLEESFKPDAPRVAGPEQCLWCQKYSCSDWLVKVRDIAKRVKEVKARMDNPFTYDEVTIAELIELYLEVPMLQDACKGIGTKLYTEAMGGTDVPGYKLVNGRKNRSWHDESDAVNLLLMAGFDAEDLYIAKFMSVAQAEKLDPKFKKSEQFKDLVKTYHSAPRLVEDSKPGAIYTGSAEDAFKGF